MEQPDILNNAYAAFRAPQNHAAVQSAVAALRERLEEVAAVFGDLFCKAPICKAG